MLLNVRFGVNREGPVNLQLNQLLNFRVLGFWLWLLAQKAKSSTKWAAFSGCFCRSNYFFVVHFWKRFDPAFGFWLSAFRNWWNKKLFHSCFKRDKDKRYILYLFNQTAFSFSTAHSPQQLFHSSQPTAAFFHSHSSTKQGLCVDKNGGPSDGLWMLTVPRRGLLPTTSTYLFPFPIGAAVQSTGASLLSIPVSISETSIYIPTPLSRCREVPTTLVMLCGERENEASFTAPKETNPVTCLRHSSSTSLHQIKAAPRRC